MSNIDRRYERHPSESENAQNLMLRYHLNLATHPFVNYRKYYLLGLLLLALGSIVTTYSVNSYLKLRDENRALVQDLSSHQKELGQLTEREVKLKEQLEQPRTLDELDRITFYNTLIQQRTFPWTQLFQDLESVIPYNTQVTQIRQRAGPGGVTVEMVFMGQAVGDAVKFLRNLSESGKFRNILVNQEGNFKEAATHRVSGEVEVLLRMDYQP